MKQWIAPSIEQLSLSHTATAGIEDSISGIQTSQPDLGTCHNDYWEGNGLPYEEAQKNNPYWSGSWGN